MINLDFPRPKGMTDAQWAEYSKKMISVLRSVTPVKTGRLRAGWELTELFPHEATITNSVPYAEYVNDGTPRMGPRNMTGKALRQITAFIPPQQPKSGNIVQRGMRSLADIMGFK